MGNPKVAIVILNWNGWKDTIECLESIFQINYDNYFVVMVDNNSTDNSFKKIIDYSNGKIEVKSEFFTFNPDNKPIETEWLSKEDSESYTNSNTKFLTLIKNEINSGFAEGNNIGIRYALKNIKNLDYILLLNNDVVVDKNFLKELIKKGEINEKIGFLGPKMYYYDDPNTIWCIGGKIDWKLARGLHIGINEVDNGQYNDNKIVDYINGAAILIKKEVIERAGLLDKNYFLYFEETDLSLRGSMIGYKSLYVPDAQIWHKVSKSGGGMKKEIGLYYITRNRWIFMKKWAPKINFLIFVPFQILLAIILPIFTSLYHKNWKLFQAYYRGLWDGITN